MAHAPSPPDLDPAPRAPGAVRFGTYNLLDLFAGGSAEDRRHYEAIAAVIRDLDTDVLAVQEILAPDAGTAVLRLRQLAADAGLRCEVPGHAGAGGTEAALAFGGHGYHVGLMWRDGIEPVPGSLRCYGRGDFWHGLALLTLDVGGTLIRHGAFHASPFCRRLRADQNERLVAAVTRPPGEPVLVGADWNTECADRVPAGALYEPADPYAGVEWFADLIYQCRWDYDDQGRRRHWADREPGDVLWAGGLHDAAAVTGAAWQPTAGHHRADVYGAHGVRRRIDAVRVTGALVPALRAHQVIDTAQTRAASDHLPVIVEYAPGTLSLLLPSPTGGAGGWRRRHRGDIGGTSRPPGGSVIHALLLPSWRRMSYFPGPKIGDYVYAEVCGWKSSVSRDLAGLADLPRSRAV